MKPNFFKTPTFLAYRLETYLVPIGIDYCPPQHVICCENYTSVGGQCIRKQYRYKYILWYDELKLN